MIKTNSHRSCRHVFATHPVWSQHGRVTWKTKHETHTWMHDAWEPKNEEHIHVIKLTGPLQDSVTWYGINYAGMQVNTQWDFQNKGKSGWIGTSPLFWKSLWVTCIIYFVPCVRILQRAYCFCIFPWTDIIIKTYSLSFCLQDDGLSESSTNSSSTTATKIQ